MFAKLIKDGQFSISISFRYLVACVLLKLFPEVFSTLGLSGAFFLNAAFCLAGSVFVVVYLPETHGLSLTELSNLFAIVGDGRFHHLLGEEISYINPCARISS